MKYNIITDLIKNHCEEIYHVEDCENFLEENELDLKWFKDVFFKNNFNLFFDKKEVDIKYIGKYIQALSLLMK